MTQTPEAPTQQIPSGAASPAPTVGARHHPNRLFQAAAWVAIVAGVVFVVAVVFFSGFILGKHSHSGGHCPRHHGEHAMMGHPGQPGFPGFPGSSRIGPGVVFPGGPADAGGMTPGGGPPQLPHSIVPPATP